MADRSAAVLAEVILSDDAAGSAAILTEQLTADPPLVLWAVCVAGGRDDLRPRSVQDVALWLAENVLEVLQWEAEGEAPDAWEGPQAGRYGDLVAVRLELAETAALLGAPDGQSAAEQAHLAGLLQARRRYRSRPVRHGGQSLGVDRGPVSQELPRRPHGRQRVVGPEG